MSMNVLALIVGLAAVFLFLLSYQFSKRRHIIICNVVSRILYVLQYLLLFAIEGAAMDISAIPSSVLAARKHTPFVQKYRLAILVCVNGFVIGIGMLVSRNWLGWIPVVGVLFETNALWLTRERNIRLLTLVAQPCWLFYNVRCGAFGGALGNVLTMASIVMAMYRYDRPVSAGGDGK